MGLIAAPRHTPEDLEAWELQSRADSVHARSPQMQRKIQQALEDIRAYNGAYVAFSCGKDSSVVLHLVRQVFPDIPVVHVRTQQNSNPDDALVLGYYKDVEIIDVTSETFDAQGRLVMAGTLERGVAIASERYGMHAYLGIRCDESSVRRISAKSLGVATDTSCRPILRWTAMDVFAYMCMFDLPIHPAYACLYGGELDRAHVRVSKIGGVRGSGHGRREWESTYYPDALAQMGRWRAPTS